MSDLFGCLTDELGGADEALALAAYAQGTSGPSWSSNSYSGAGMHAANPLLKRSRLYYQIRDRSMPVGLDNQGATCYLNSLLQALYLTPEFRELLFSLTDDELGLSHYHAHEAAEAEAKAALERMSDEERAAAKAAQALQSVEISEERVAEYTAMGIERTNVVRALRKFPAASQSEALLDYLFTHDFASDPPEPDAQAKPKARLYKRIPIEFRRFFAQLQLGTQGVIGTEGITRSFGWDAKAGQASVQHDIQELYIRLMEALSGSLAGSTAEARMAQLYRGGMATRTTCSACGAVSARTESVYNFTAHVKGVPGKSLVRSLEMLVAPEKMQGANAYFCHADACKRKQSAWRQECIASLPPLLTFALNRHEYNKKNWQRVKINDRLAFPLVLDMEPYHESRAAKTREQLEADDARSAAAAAAPASSSSAAAAAAPATDLDRAIANSLKTPEELQADAAAAAANKQQAQQSKGGKKGGKKGGGKGASQGGPDDEVDDASPAGLEPSVFDPSSSQLYDLFAVVVHSGGAHGGHYYSYVRDVIAHNNYLDAHPDARAAYDTFARDPLGASAAAPPGPGQKASGYSGDASRSAHPSFWYELNDASVAPISFDKIASQYGGRRTCAYILMYRHRSLDAAAAGGVARGAGPAVPAALQERMARFNAQLDAERAVYDRISNEIEVELHSEHEFSVHDGQLFPADWDPARAGEEDRALEERRELLAMEDAANGNAMDGFGLLEEEGSGGGGGGGGGGGAEDANAPPTASASPAASAPVAPAATAAPAAPRRFVVDQRITVPELHARVVEFLASEVAAATADGVAPAPAPEKIVLNQLSLKLRPPHQVEGYLSLDDPLDGAAAAPAAQGGKKAKKAKPNPKTLEQLGFSAVQHLLVWDGAAINGKAFVTGTKKDQVLNLRCVLFGAEAVSAAKAAAAAAAAAECGEGGASASASAPLLDASLPSTPERLEFFLAVSPTTNLSQLASALASRLGLAAESLALLAMHPVSKALKPLRLGGDADDSLKPLKVLGVINHSWMGVEVRAASSSGDCDSNTAATGLAAQYFSEMQQCVRLVVVDSLAPSSAGAAAAAAGSPPVPAHLEVEALKSSTVLQLKQQVLARLQGSHPGLTLAQFRLRKVAGLDKAGALLGVESATLAQADLAEDDMRVRAEEGPLPDPLTQLDLLVTLLANVSVGVGAGPETAPGAQAEAAQPKLALAKLVDRAPFVAEKSWTIKQTKVALLSHFGLGHRGESSFCLYRGHATYDEHAKAFTNEFMSLAQMQLAQSEWLWLEEGEVPTSGLVQIEAVLCTEKPMLPGAAAGATAAAAADSSASSSSAAASPVDDSSLSLLDWRTMQQPLSAYTPAIAADGAQAQAAPVTAAAVAEAVTATADGSASSAPVVPSTAVVPSSSNGSSSNNTISHVFVAPRTIIHLCPLFTLPFSCNDTLLELKQALHAYPDSPLGAAPSPAHLRVRLCSRADGLGKWLSVDERTLKKQGVSADKRLLVQLLPPDRPEQNLTTGAMLLRVCTAVPRPANEGGGVRVGPAALQELVFDDGEYPQLAALQRALAAFAAIPAEHVAVLKWIGMGAVNKEKEAADQEAAGKDNKSAEGSSSSSDAAPAASNTAADSDAAAPPSSSSSLSSSPAAPAAGAGMAASASVSASASAPRGWVVLFPDGPDPSHPAAATAPNAADNKAKGQQQKQKQQQQQGKGGNKQQQQQGGPKGGQKGNKSAGAVAPPNWSIKFGPFGVHDDDVLMCVDLRDFGCGDLGALSAMARAWGIGVAPPGFTLVEKDRADEIERLAERERARKAAPKHKEIELKIEY